MEFNIKKYWLILAAFVLGIPSVLAQTANSAPNTFLKPLNDILNAIATFIGSTGAAEFATRNGVQPWNVVGLTFLLVTGIIAAALSFVKIFEKRKGATITIAVIMGISASAAPGIPEMVFSIFEVAVPILIIAVLVFLYRIVWHGFGAAAKDQKALSETASAAVYKAEKNSAEAQKDKEGAVADLKAEEEMIKREGNVMKEIDNHIDEITGANLEQDLKTIALAISRLQETRDSNESLTLKKKIQQRIAALSGRLTVKDNATHAIENTISKLNNLLVSEFSTSDNFKKRIKILENMWKSSTGRNKITDKKKNELHELLSRYNGLEKEHKDLIKKLNKDTKIVEQASEKIKNALTQVVTNIYNDNFPSAITAINQTLNANENNKTATIMLRSTRQQVSDIERNLTRFNNDLTNAMR